MHRYTLVGLVLAACGGTGSTPDASPVFEPAQVERWRAPPGQLDLLFMVDDSIGIYEEQASLAANFPVFVAALEAAPGGLPDLHLGVISSSVSIGTSEVMNCDGDGGRLHAEGGIAGCVPPEGSFIVDEACDAGAPPDCRTRNYTGELADVFTCIASLGEPGCGFEQPLESIRLALDPLQPPVGNGGFHRPDAHLAIVILSDEDDCSAADTTVFDSSDARLAELGPLTGFRCTEFGLVCDGAPPAREAASYESCEPREDSYLRHPRYYLDFLRSLKADPTRVSLAAIVGPPQPVTVGLDSFGAPELLPSCHSMLGDAAPAVRLAWLVEQLGDRGLFTSICGGMAGALEAIGAWLSPQLASGACLEGPVASVDLDPAAPGLQLDCQVADVANRDTDLESWTRLPACAMQDATTPAADVPRPCWYVMADPAACPDTPTHLLLDVARAAPPADELHLAIRCVGQ